MIYSPPIGSIYHLYTTYILPIGWLYATYHLLREPGNSIEHKDLQWMLNIVFGCHPCHGFLLGSGNFFEGRTVKLLGRYQLRWWILDMPYAPQHTQHKLAPQPCLLPKLHQRLLCVHQIYGQSLGFWQPINQSLWFQQNMRTELFVKNGTYPPWNKQLPSENGWLEDEFPFGARPIFKGELWVLGSVKSGSFSIAMCSLCFGWVEFKPRSVWSQR